ncbi:hypothetical protein [Luteitalea sp.]
MVLYIGRVVTAAGIADTGDVFSFTWLGRPPGETIRESYERMVPIVSQAVSTLFGRAKRGPHRWLFFDAGGGPSEGLTVEGATVFWFDTSEPLGATKDRYVERMLTLAHELTHREPAGQLKGLSIASCDLGEGLVELLARRALYRARLLYPEDVLEALNAKFALVSNTRLKRHGREAAVACGDVLATNLDGHVRTASRGGSDILDLLARLLAGASERESVTVTKELLQRELSKVTGLNVPLGTRASALLRGSTRDALAAAAFVGCAHLAREPVWEYALGFDLERSVARRRVIGLVKGGAAHRAGLREGQELFYWSVVVGRADKIATFGVSQGGKTRWLKFYPRGGAPRTQLTLSLEPRSQCNWVF